jgi:hypothetical protein
MAKKRKFAPFAMQFCLLLSTILVLTSCPASPPLAPTDGFNPYLAPEEPTGLQATNGYADSISLSWEKVEGATGYQIWATPTEQYGTATKSISTDDTYSKLLARGFELVDVVTEPSCKLRELDANTAYIFSVVAMKSMKNTQGTSVLYSEPSNFVEGATFGEITLSAVANSKTITLYWDISNLYSILNDSREKQPLYTYNISIYKKLSSSGDWGEGKSLTWEEAQGQTFSFSASALEIDTAYDFKLHLEVLDEDKNVINTIESDAITITSDSSPTPNSVENISVTNGLTRHEVTLTWTAPALSQREDIKSVFRLERAETGSTEWTEITTTVTQNADGTYSATDTTLEDNKTYTYRILNGYQIGTKTPVYQAETDAAALQEVYALWMPQDITFIFTKDSDNKSGELEVTYKYNPPATNPAGEIKCYLEGSTWTEKDLSAHTALEKLEITSTAPTYNVSIEDLRPLTYYTFNFTFTRDGQELVNAKAPTDYTLGETGAADLIENFSASNAWVKAICLTWNETDLISSSTDTFNYEIYQDNVKLENVEIEGTGSAKSAYITCEDGVTHNYRIKVASEDGNTFEVDETSGSTLAVPTGLTATDGTSIDEITITWPQVDNDKLTYKLNYSYDGTTWTELPASSTGVTTEGLATLSAKSDGTDGSLVSFKLVVSNSDQLESGLASAEDITTLESELETGSVLGPALLNVRIENDGLDPDKITIKWDKVEGADHYRIMRGDTLLPWSKNADTYEDKVENLQALSGESPLNASYTYTVIPCLADGTQAKITDQSTMAKATGKLFAPPKDVSATKGQEGITLTWSAVENAKKYEIQKYVVSLENGKFTKQVESGATVTVESTTYKEIDKSLLSGYVLYKLRSVKEDGTVSQWQEYYNTVTNALGFEEPANIGYKLQNVSDLNVTEVINDAGYYADYATVTWYMVPGATSYTLKSYTGTDTKTLVGTSTISVDSLIYSETETVNNGVTGGKGFLSYDPTVGLYTYNAGYDNFKDSCKITNYKIIANSETAKSGTTDRNTEIYLQPTAKDWVNIVLNILHPAFKAANSKFNGDWWLPSLQSKNYTYSDSDTGLQFTFTLSGSASYNNVNNYLKISTSTDEDTKPKLTITSTSNIQFDVTSGGNAGYLDTDPLTSIGYNGNGTIAVTPDDSKLKSFTIKFNNVSVTSTPGGSFTVTITDIAGSTETTVNDSSDLTRVLGD